MNFLRSQFEKHGKKIGLTGAALVAFVDQCMAAVPTAVTDAIATGQTDSLTVAGLWLAAIIAVSAFLLMRRGTGR
jgi:hypothetical protein